MAQIRGKNATRATPPTNSGGKQSVTIAAAAKWKVAPETLWGMYGTESGFGVNLGPSSAGALGPMQFLPSTGRGYGLNSSTIMDFTASMFAAAHYLHDLGANTDPNSQKTKEAVQGYNTGKPGNTAPAYLAEVEKPAQSWRGGAGAAGSVADPTTGGGGTAPASAGGAPDVLQILGDIASLNIEDLAAQLALTGVWIVKNVTLGIVDLIIAPAWHWNQRAVQFYGTTVLNPKNVADGNSEYQYAFIWTSIFWGMGYYLLWTEPGGGLKVAPVSRSRVARHVRKAQAVPARKSLVKPKDVSAKTPKKPKERISRANVKQIGTMTTTRNRSIRVAGRELAGRTDTTAETSVHETRTLPADPGKHDHPPAKPHPEHRTGQGTPKGSGATST